MKWHRVVFQARVVEGDFAVGVQQGDEVGVRELPARFMCVAVEPTLRKASGALQFSCQNPPAFCNVWVIGLIGLSWAIRGEDSARIV